MLLCDICNAGWHMDCITPQHTTIPPGIWKCPLCTLPEVPCNTSVSSLPFLTLTLTKHRLIKKKKRKKIKPLLSIKLGYPLSVFNKNSTLKEEKQQNAEHATLELL